MLTLPTHTQGEMPVAVTAGQREGTLNVPTHVFSAPDTPMCTKGLRTAPLWVETDRRQMAVG